MRRCRASSCRLQRDVQYVLPPSRRRLVLGHLFFALRRPAVYVSTLARLLARPHPNARARRKTLLHFAEAVYAAALVRRRGFDEFHAHFADRAATIALITARLLDRPYSLSVHAGADIYVDPVLLPEKVRTARHVLTCTARNKVELTSVVGADVGTKITVVPHGLDLRAYRPASRATAAPPIILAVGQCKARKGFTQLVTACRTLRSEGVAFTCRIIGDGPQRAALAAMVREWELDDVVQLLGARASDEVLREYQRATVFALPCVEADDGDVDGIPNVLLEAMACGVPALSTDLSAIRELIVSGRNGVLVPPDDTTALAIGLRDLLANPSRRADLGEAGRATVAAGFDADINARRFASVLWPEHMAELAGAGQYR